MAPTQSITIYDLDGSTYLENSGVVTVDADFSISGGGNFTGGFVEYSIEGATASESLGLRTDASPSDQNGVISLVDTTVYRGTGSDHQVIGSISATDNGMDGQPLRINFSNAFENGDFDNGSAGQTIITGWTTQVNEGITSLVHLDGVYQIAGQPTPVDTTYPANNNNGDQSTPLPGEAFTQHAFLADIGSQDYAIRLDTGDASISQGYGVIRGPYVYSDGTVALQEGDTVSFDWRALSGGDAYDAYGYIIDVNTGETITILDDTGESWGTSTDWATETITIGPSQEGTYRFVFVAGSFDATGGQYLGGELMIDAVSVTQANPPDAITEDDINQIIDRLTYTNTADDFADLTRTLNILAQDGTANSGTADSTIVIVPINDAPMFVAGPDQAVDEDSGYQIIAGWATQIDSIEQAQSLIFNLSNNNNELFSIQPTVTENGTLFYKPADDAHGTATVTVLLSDDGGTANGGVDTSAPQTFTITVNPVDAPPLILPDYTPPAQLPPVIIAPPATGAPQGDPEPQPIHEPEPQQPLQPVEGPAVPVPVQLPEAPPIFSPAPPAGFADGAPLSGIPQIVLTGMPIVADGLFGPPR